MSLERAFQHGEKERTWPTWLFALPSRFCFSSSCGWPSVSLIEESNDLCSPERAASKAIFYVAPGLSCTESDVAAADLVNGERLLWHDTNMALLLFVKAARTSGLLRPPRLRRGCMTPFRNQQASRFETESVRYPPFFKVSVDSGGHNSTII